LVGWRQDNGNRSNQKSKFDFLNHNVPIVFNNISDDLCELAETFGFINFTDQRLVVNVWNLAVDVDSGECINERFKWPWKQICLECLGGKDVLRINKELTVVINYMSIQDFQLKAEEELHGDNIGHEVINQMNNPIHLQEVLIKNSAQTTIKLDTGSGVIYGSGTDEFGFRGRERVGHCQEDDTVIFRPTSQDEVFVLSFFKEDTGGLCWRQPTTRWHQQLLRQR